MEAHLALNQEVRVRILGDVLNKASGIRRQEPGRRSSYLTPVYWLPTPNLVLWSNGDDTCVTCRRRWFNSIRDHSTRSAGVLAGTARRVVRRCGKAEDRVQFPDGPLERMGLHADGGELGLQPGWLGSTPNRSTFGMEIRSQSQRHEAFIGDQPLRYSRCPLCSPWRIR